MSRERIPVVVVGAGHLGRIHAKIYAESDQAQLIAVCDLDQERAEQVAREFGVVAARDPMEFADQARAFSVAVSTKAHAEVATPLLERGLACLVEKPLASNLADADRILAASERSGAVLAVGHVERFQPSLRRVRELGIAPRFIECHRLTAFSFRSMDVGVVHDLMIHDLDLVLDLVGSEVTSFDAVGGKILTEHEDMASVRLVFANGARANITANRVSLSPMRRFRMFSPESYVSLDFQKNYALIARKGPKWEEERPRLAALGAEGKQEIGDVFKRGLFAIEEPELLGQRRPLQAQLDAFLRCVRTGEQPEVGGAEGRRALELADRVVAAIAGQDW